MFVKSKSVWNFPLTLIEFREAVAPPVQKRTTKPLQAYKYAPSLPQNHNSKSPHLKQNEVLRCCVFGQCWCGLGPARREIHHQVWQRQLEGDPPKRSAYGELRQLPFGQEAVHPWWRGIEGWVEGKIWDCSERFFNRCYSRCLENELLEMQW